MKPVFVAADNIFSPLGISTEENYIRVKHGLSAVRQIDNASLSNEPFFASMFSNNLFEETKEDFTRFEQACIASVQDALSKCETKILGEDTLFILSTTKGNIEWIENAALNEQTTERISLFGSAKQIAKHFGFKHQPVVVSNACISGVLAIITAKRLLQSGKYKHAVITGADVLSKFVISGFQALQAMSSKPCRPFDKDRDGINLGECAATIVLTTEKLPGKNILVNGGASSNDANHISGPSRTGLELCYAIQSTLHESNVHPHELSFISAHGTATVYNDEMEAKAFSHAGLSAIPLFSLKPNFGHTLGAAGVLESVLSYQSLQEHIIPPSLNFESSGVSEPINVNIALLASDKIHALKTASGFGGCNAAILFSQLN